VNRLRWTNGAKLFTVPENPVTLENTTMRYTIRITDNAHVNPPDHVWGDDQSTLIGGFRTIAGLDRQLRRAKDRIFYGNAWTGNIGIFDDSGNKVAEPDVIAALRTN